MSGSAPCVPIMDPRSGRRDFLSRRAMSHLFISMATEVGEAAARGRLSRDNHQGEGRPLSRPLLGDIAHRHPHPSTQKGPPMHIKRSRKVAQAKL